jgi:hypothetical protein
MVGSYVSDCRQAEKTGTYSVTRENGGRRFMTGNRFQRTREEESTWRKAVIDKKEIKSDSGALPPSAWGAWWAAESSRFSAFRSN